MDLSQRENLAPFLRRHGVDPRKSFGQHFLCSPSVVRSIVDAVPDGASVLEIGPGPGILTSALTADHQVVAVEIDVRMKPMLAESAPLARLVWESALDVDLAALLNDMSEPRAVVSNLPYYITGPLLDRIARAKRLWSKAVLMMQREVGDKVLAKVGDRQRGALSVRMQAEFEVMKVCSVPPGAFLPPPKVESVVLALVPRPEEFPEALFRFVAQGFSQPRKTVANNLASAGFSKEAVEQAGLAPTIRPHQLSLEEWQRIWVTCQST